MGLFTTYLIYRSGRRRAERRAEIDRLEELEFENEICRHCGYVRAQHDDDGYCPVYIR